MLKNYKLILVLLFWSTIPFVLHSQSQKDSLFVAKVVNCGTYFTLPTTACYNGSSLDLNKYVSDSTITQQFICSAWSAIVGKTFYPNKVVFPSGQDTLTVFFVWSTSSMGSYNTKVIVKKPVFPDLTLPVSVCSGVLNAKTYTADNAKFGKFIWSDMAVTTRDSTTFIADVAVSGKRYYLSATTVVNGCSFTDTASLVNGGKLSLTFAISPVKQVYYQGDKITITATPKLGTTITSYAWSTSLGETGTNNTFTPQKDTSMLAILQATNPFGCVTVDTFPIVKFSRNAQFRTYQRVKYGDSIWFYPRENKIHKWEITNTAGKVVFSKTTASSDSFMHKFTQDGMYFVKHTIDTSRLKSASTEVTFIDTVEVYVIGLRSPVATVSEETISVFPNPTSGRVSIQGTTQKIDVSFFNLRGSLLKTSSDSEIDIESFPAGTYMILVKTASGSVYRTKVVKY